jgi:glycosyltransferase involved in cell wall biosynthesis
MKPDTDSPSLRICVVSHFAYGALRGGEGGHVGGVERQTSLVARWLAQRGHRVTLVTWDEGQPEGIAFDGVRVLKLCRRDAGLPGLRFVHPRWTSLTAALRRADADVYYQNCAEYVTGQVALWAGRRGRRFVFSAASDLDCDPRLPGLPALRERVLYRYGLRHADRRIVQTRAQQRMLHEGFGLAADVLPMPCPGPSKGEYVPPCFPERGARVLWVATSLWQAKRPDRVLDLAEACPDLSFDLVGPPGDGAEAGRILERARSLTNVTWHGRLTRDRLADLYRQSACLCCTSDYEGFPNTFLEAWSHGLPVVSTIDPDGLIASRFLGVSASGVAGLAKGIRDLFRSPERWRGASDRARRYYEENHTPEAACLRLEQVFRQAVTVEGFPRDARPYSRPDTDGEAARSRPRAS